MRLLYADALGGYSDPSSSGLKHMRADGEWAAPDADHKFLDATGSWSVPDLASNIANMSWKRIETISALAAESPQDYAEFLGQSKTIDMSSMDGESDNVTAMVIGIGHDVDPHGKRLGFTFQLRNIVPWLGLTMNESGSEKVGWRDSLMRSTNLPELKEAMPEELRSRLKVMVKKTYVTDSFDALVETQDDLALLSQTEVFGDEVNPSPDLSLYWPKGEGERYQWYADHDTDADRIIKRCSGFAQYWWLRTIYISTLFRAVSYDGRCLYNDPSIGQGPCPCFCV